MEKKIIIILAIGLLITSTVLAQQVIFTDQATDLKTEANGDIIGEIPKGTEVEVIESNEGWKKVQITGWIKASHTTKSEEAVSKSRVVESYSGNGMRTMRPFEVDGSWEVQWEANGQIFQIYLHTKSGRMAGVLANQQGAGSGSSYQAKSGEYYLKVNSMGDWNVKIIDVE
jgi:hypothetical protein